MQERDEIIGEINAKNKDVKNSSIASVDNVASVSLAQSHTLTVANTLTSTPAVSPIKLAAETLSVANTGLMDIVGAAPLDISVMMLSGFSLAQRAKLSEVSKRWRAVVDSERMWKDVGTGIKSRADYIKTLQTKFYVVLDPGLAKDDNLILFELLSKKNDKVIKIQHIEHIPSPNPLTKNGRVDVASAVTYHASNTKSQSLPHNIGAEYDYLIRALNNFYPSLEHACQACDNFLECIGMRVGNHLVPRYKSRFPVRAVIFEIKTAADRPVGIHSKPLAFMRNTKTAYVYGFNGVANVKKISGEVLAQPVAAQSVNPQENNSGQLTKNFQCIIS